MHGPSAAQMENWLSATRFEAAPVVRRTAGGLNGASRGGTWIDYDGVRCPADGYELLLAAIFAVPPGAAIEADDDGRRAAAVVD